MTAAEIGQWLKTSVVGIVILGAMGSAIAILLGKALVALAKGVSFCFKKALPALAARIAAAFARRRKKLYYIRGYRFGYMAGGFDTWGAVFYFSYHLLCCLLLALLSCTAFIVFLVLLLSPKGPAMLSAGSYAFLLLTFLFAYRASGHFIAVHYPYKNIGKIRQWERERDSKKAEETDESPNKTAGGDA